MPKSYCDIPDLLYIDYVWDEDSKADWLGLSHTARIALLNARAGGLSDGIPTLPITLYYETDTYDDFIVADGLADVGMYLNGSGHLFLGFFEDFKAHMAWYPAATTSESADDEKVLSYWIGLRANCDRFRMTSGDGLARRLADMYDAVKEGTLWIYKDLAVKLIEAHNDWVAAGAYTYASDPRFEPDLGTKVSLAMTEQHPGRRAALLRLYEHKRAGVKLRALRKQFDARRAQACQGSVQLSCSWWRFGPSSLHDPGRRLAAT